MNSVSTESQFFKQLLSMLAMHFGTNCEVVLHDLTKDYSCTIVQITNGHVTNRTVGGCGSNLGLEVLRGTDQDGDRYNYVNHTSDGKIIRSSSMYIRDENDKVIGSLCVNIDITEAVHFEGYLKKMTNYEIGREEVFVNDVGNLLTYLINKAQTIIAKPFTKMSKDEKIEFIKYLDDKGAFLISKSGDKVCEILNISKFTLYNYLEAARGESKEKS